MAQESTPRIKFRIIDGGDISEFIELDSPAQNKFEVYDSNGECFRVDVVETLMMSILSNSTTLYQGSNQPFGSLNMDSLIQKPSELTTQVWELVRQNQQDDHV